MMRDKSPRVNNALYIFSIKVSQRSYCQINILESVSQQSVIQDSLVVSAPFLKTHRAIDRLRDGNIYENWSDLKKSSKVGTIILQTISKQLNYKGRFKGCLAYWLCLHLKNVKLFNRYLAMAMIVLRTSSH